jgi:hypothetical protein
MTKIAFGNKNHFTIPKVSKIDKFIVIRFEFYYRHPNKLRLKPSQQNLLEPLMSINVQIMRSESDVLSHQKQASVSARKGLMLPKCRASINKCGRKV